MNGRCDAKKSGGGSDALALVFNELTWCRRFINDPFLCFLFALLIREGLKQGYDQDIAADENPLSRPSNCRRRDIPPEVLEHVMGYLDHATLASVGTACRHCHRASKSDKFWAALCRRSFGTSIDEISPPPKSALQLYQILLGSMYSVAYGASAFNLQTPMVIYL